MVFRMLSEKDIRKYSRICFFFKRLLFENIWAEFNQNFENLQLLPRQNAWWANRFPNDVKDLANVNVFSKTSDFYIPCHVEQTALRV